MESLALPMTAYTYVDDGTVFNVVDVIKLYPSILNNSNWRDATNQFLEACDHFHPYVFDILNDWSRSPFGGCVNAANIQMKNQYVGIQANAGFYLNTSYVYGYAAPVFGSVGLLCVLLTLALFRRNPTLHMPYGVMVFFQCVLLVLLLIDFSTLETVYLIQRAPFTGIINQTNVIYPYGIFINSDRIDRYMVFVNLALSVSIASLRVTTGGILPYTICAKVLTTSYMVIRIAIAILGMALSIVTLIRFRKYFKGHKWSKLKMEQERTLIIQTFCDLIDFFAIFMPMLIYRLLYLCPYCVSRIMPYINVFSIMSSKPTTIACLGHCIDSIITFYLMRKLVKLNRKTDTTIVFPFE